MLQNKNPLTVASRPAPMTNVDTPDSLAYMPPQMAIKGARNALENLPRVSSSPLPAPVATAMDGSPVPPEAETNERRNKLVSPYVIRNSGIKTSFSPLVSAEVERLSEQAKLLSGIRRPIKAVTPYVTAMSKSSTPLLMATAAPETPEEAEGSLAWFARRTGEGAMAAGPEVLNAFGGLVNAPWYIGAMVETQLTGKTDGWWYNQAKMAREASEAYMAEHRAPRVEGQTTLQKLYDPGIVIPMVANFGTQIAMMMTGGGLVAAGAKGAGVAMSAVTANRLATAAGGVLGGAVEGQNTYFEALEKGMTTSQAGLAFAKHASLSGAISMTQLSFLLNKMPAPLQQKMLRRVVAGGWDAVTETLDETVGAWSLDPDLSWKEALQVTKDAFGEIGTGAFIVGMLTGGMGLPPEMALRAATATDVQGQVDYGVGGGKSIVDLVGEDRLKAVLEGEATYFRAADGKRHSTFSVDPETGEQIRGTVVQDDNGSYWIPGRYGKQGGELLPVPLANIAEVGVFDEQGGEIPTYGSESYQALRSAALTTNAELFGVIESPRTKTFAQAKNEEMEAARNRLLLEVKQRIREGQDKEFERFTSEFESALSQQEKAADNVRGVEDAVRSGLPEIKPDAAAAADVPLNVSDKMFAQLEKMAETEWQGKIGTARWLGLDAKTRKQKVQETARRMAGLKGSVSKLQSQVSQGIAPAETGTFAAEVEALVAQHALTGTSTPIEQLMEEDFVAKSMVDMEAEVQAKLRAIETIGARTGGGSIEDTAGNSYSLHSAPFGPEASAAPQALSAEDVAKGADEFLKAPVGSTEAPWDARSVPVDYAEMLTQYMGGEAMVEAVKSGETTVEDVLMRKFQEGGKLQFVAEKTKGRHIVSKATAAQSDESYNANMMAYVSAVREAKTALGVVMEQAYAAEYGLEARQYGGETALPADANEAVKDVLLSKGTKTKLLRGAQKSAAEIHGFAATMKQTNLYNSLVRAGAILGWQDNYRAAELASETVYGLANAWVAVQPGKRTVAQYYDKYLGDLIVTAEQMNEAKLEIRRATIGFSTPSEMLFSKAPTMTLDDLSKQLSKSTASLQIKAENVARSGLFPTLSLTDIETKLDEYTDPSSGYTNVYSALDELDVKQQKFAEGKIKAVEALSAGIEAKKKDPATPWSQLLNPVKELLIPQQVKLQALATALEQTKAGYVHGEVAEIIKKLDIAQFLDTVEVATQLLDNVNYKEGKTYEHGFNAVLKANAEALTKYKKNLSAEYAVKYGQERTHADLERTFRNRLQALQAQRNFNIWVGSPHRHGDGRGNKLPKSRDLRFNPDGTPRIWFYGTNYEQDRRFGWIDTARPHPFFHFGSYQAASQRRGDYSNRRTRMIPLVTNMANAFVCTDGQANNPYSLAVAIAYANGRTNFNNFKGEMLDAGYDLSTPQKTAKAAMEFFGYDGGVYPNRVEGTTDTERMSVIALIPNTVKSVYHKDIPYIDGEDLLLSSVEDQVLGSFDPNSRDIELFLGSDLHTVLHEFAHAWRFSLDEAQLRAVGKWANGSKWKAGQPWSVEAEEKFANSFVAWAGSGNAKVPAELQSVFDDTAKYLTGLYSTGKALRPDVKVSKAMSDVMERLITKQLMRSKSAEDREEGRRRSQQRASFKGENRKDLGDEIDMMAEFLNLGPKSVHDKADLYAEMMSRKQNPAYRKELDAKLLEWEENGNPAIDLVDFMIVRDRAIEIRVAFEADFAAAYRKGPEAVQALVAKMAQSRVEMDVRFYRLVAGDAGRRLQALTNRATNIDTAVLLGDVERRFGKKGFEILYQMMKDPANAWALADQAAGEMAPSLWDMYMQAYYGFRLSSPDVLAVNFIGTGMWTMWNYSVHRPFAGMIDLGMKAMSNITGWGKVLDRFYFQGNSRARDHFNTSVLPLYAQLGRSIPYGYSIGKDILMDRTGSVHTLASVKNMDISTRDVNSWQRFTMRREGLAARALRRVFGATAGDVAIQKWEDTVRTLGPLVSASTTIMRASDMMFKVIAVEGEMNRIAQEEAVRMFPNNPSAQDGWIRSRTAEIISDPGKLTAPQAERLRQVAEYNTFTDMPLKASRHISAYRESLPLIKLVFPYFNTLVNLGKRGLEMVPVVGLGFEAMYRTDPSFDKSSYGHTKADIIAKQLEGAMFVAGVFLLLDEDELTGAAPTDPYERKHFYEAGKLEYAIKLGDHWYSYANIQPFNVALSMTANVRKYALANVDKLGSDNAEVQEKVNRDLMQAAWSIGSFMLNNDFMRSFEQFATAETWQRQAKVLGSTAESAVIPYNGFLRWMMRAENMMQNPEGYFVPQDKTGIGEIALPLSHNIMNKLFGLPLTEMNRLTVWGEPYSYSENKWYDSWLPVQYSKADQDNVDKTLEELGYMPAPPQRQYEMNKKTYQYDREIWQQLALAVGAESKPKVAKLIDSPGFQRKHKEDKVLAIQKVMKEVRAKHERKAKAAQRRAGLKPVGETL